MLQKDADSRPSASDIYSTRLPQLMKKFHQGKVPSTLPDDDMDPEAISSAKWVEIVN